MTENERERYGFTAQVDVPVETAEYAQAVAERRDVDAVTVAVDMMDLQVVMHGD